MQTYEYCRKLDPAYSWEGDVLGTPLAESLQFLNGVLLPEDKLPTDQPTLIRQQKLSRCLETVEHETFIESLDAADRTTVLSEMLEGASDFLEATPAGDCAMAPEEFICEIQTRLCMNQIPADTWCPLCDMILDAKGRHAH
eukprot:2117937-Karenia_brevis.AAC.1